MARQKSLNNVYDQNPEDEEEYVPKSARPDVQKYAVPRHDPRGTMQSRSHLNNASQNASGNNNPSGAARRRIQVAVCIPL